MKKTLIAAAALAATTGAMAFDVSLRGRLDAGYADTTYTRGDGKYTDSGVVSHNAASSMFNIQGSEDLGDGMTMSFKLESDVYTANGNTGVSGAGTTGLTPYNSYPGDTTGGLFNRASRIDLTTGYGSIGFGRDYTPLFTLAAATDLNGLSRISTVNSPGAGVGTTLPNQIFYKTPVLFGGMVVNASLWMDDNSKEDSISLNTTTGAATTTAGKTTRTSKGGTLTITYGSPLSTYLAAGVGQVKFQGGASAGGAVTLSALPASGLYPGSPIIAGHKTQTITGATLAASTVMGPIKLAGNVITYDSTYDKNNLQTAAFGDLEFSGSEVNFGAQYTMGAMRLAAQVGVNQRKAELNNSVEQKGTDFVLGAYYDLFKNTYVYVKTGVVNSFDEKKPSGTGYLTTMGKQDDTSSAIGFVTNF